MYSSGINFVKKRGLEGKGNLLEITFTTNNAEYPNAGTYPIDSENFNAGYIKLGCYIDVEPDGSELLHFYIFNTGTLLLNKEGNEYELTIEGNGNEINRSTGEIINDSILIVATYKGNLSIY